MLPQIAQSFHVSIGAAGQLTTVYALAYALLSPAAAAAFAQVERKMLMLSGLGIFILANLATAWAPRRARSRRTRRCDLCTDGHGLRRQHHAAR